MPWGRGHTELWHAMRAATLSLLLLALVAMSCAAWAQQQVPPGDAAAGKQLFSGKRPFQNGGPACASCHSIAGISFPNGGVLGPELTKTYTRFGPQGMDAMLATLYFPAMVPLFENHPLTPEEQADLKAFFQSAASLPPPPDYTLAFGLIALGGLGILLGAAALIWKARLRGVREPLLKRARGERA
jgi:mono/diheme cytochrome c family protein